MPTYQYRCTENHESEIVQSFTDEPLRVCPTCGAPVRKVYGSVGVVFKGSGFYRNDSRDKKSTSTANTPAETKNDPSKAGGTTATKDSGSSSGSDSGSSKPAAAPAASSPSASSSGSAA